jgi:AcrR family transcriptional regulator
MRETRSLLHGVDPRAGEELSITEAVMPGSPFGIMHTMQRAQALNLEPAEEAPVPRLRDRQKQQTREALVIATLDLCSQRGFDEATIAEIARRAGTSVRTFYAHFPSKEAAVLFNAEDDVEALRLVLANPGGQPVLSRLRAHFRAIAEERDHGPRREMLETQIAIARSAPQLLARIAHVEFKTWQMMTDAFAAETGDRELAENLAGAVIGVMTSTVWAERSRGRYADHMERAFAFLESAFAPLLKASSEGAPRRTAIKPASRRRS